MIQAIAFLRQWLPQIIGAIIVAFFVGVAYLHGVTTTRDHYEAVLAQRDAHDADMARQQAQALADLQARAIQTEHAAQQRLTDIQKQHSEELQHAISSRESVIAGLRAGTVQLRKRFTCPTGGSQRVPKDASAAGGSDGASTGGLQPEDAGFLVRFASRCDEVALQLSECQKYIKINQ